MPLNPVILLWVSVAVMFCGCLLVGLAYVVPLVQPAKALEAGAGIPTRTAQQVMALAYDQWTSDGIATQVVMNGTTPVTQVTSWTSVGGKTLYPYVALQIGYNTNQLTAGLSPNSSRGVTVAKNCWLQAPDNAPWASYPYPTAATSTNPIGNLSMSGRTFIMVGSFDALAGAGLVVSEYNSWEYPKAGNSTGGPINGDYGAIEFGVAATVSGSQTLMTGLNQLYRSEIANPTFAPITGRQTVVYGVSMDRNNKVFNAYVNGIPVAQSAVSQLWAYVSTYKPVIQVGRTIAYAGQSLPGGVSATYQATDNWGGEIGTYYYVGMWGSVLTDDDHVKMATYLKGAYIETKAPKIAYSAAQINAYVGTPIEPVTMLNTGGLFQTLTATDATGKQLDLAALTGLVFDTNTGALSGTPTTPYSANVTFTATNHIGSYAYTVTMNVQSSSTNDPVLVYTPTSEIIVYKNVPIAPGFAVVNTGQTQPSVFANDQITALTNAGIVFDTRNGSFYGTPTATLVRTHVVVTGTVNAVDVGTVDVYVTVLDSMPVGLPEFALTTSTDVVKSVRVGYPITPIEFSDTGGNITAFAISPDITATVGLAFATDTGKVSGTPTKVIAPTKFVVTATSPGGTAQCTFVLSTTLRHVVRYLYDSVEMVVGQEVSIKPLYEDLDTLTFSTTAPAYLDDASYTLSGVTNEITGVTLDEKTGEIAGTPTVASKAQQWTVTITTANITMTRLITVTCDGVFTFAGSLTFDTGAAFTMYPVFDDTTAVKFFVGNAWPEFLTVDKKFAVSGFTVTPIDTTLDCSVVDANGITLRCNQRFTVRDNPDQVVTVINGVRTVLKNCPHAMGPEDVRVSKRKRRDTYNTPTMMTGIGAAAAGAGMFLAFLGIRESSSV